MTKYVSSDPILFELAKAGIAEADQASAALVVVKLLEGDTV